MRSRRVETAVNGIRAFEANTKLADWHERLEQVRKTTITQRGRPTARSVPSVPAVRQARIKQSAACVLARAEELTLCRLDVRQLANEGRP